MPPRDDGLGSAPWAAPARALLDGHGVALERGLSEAEVRRRRATHGPNRLREVEPRGTLEILLAQLKSAIVLLLAVGAALSFAFGHALEGGAIVAVVVLNTLLGFVTELRAVRSMEALRKLGEVTATVRRDGALKVVPATELVPGDVMILEAGDVVTADLRVVDASALSADESTLTGESVPVDKQVDPAAENAPLAERFSMLFKGTTVTRGAGEGLVVGTGMATELGRISDLLAQVEDQSTPLERRLERLGRQLMLVSLVFVALATGLGLARGEDLYLMIESAIALAVATVPEGLPVVATIALARGMWRMARRNALIEELSAVETLGSTSLILTDKTGTLTENRMRAVRLLVEGATVDLDADGPTADGRPLDDETRALFERALRVAVEGSEATVPEGDGPAVGDPLEVALVAAGERFGLRRDALLAEEPEIRELAFDPDLKLSGSEHRMGDRVHVAIKGAPEAVLERATRTLGPDGPRPLDAADRRRWLADNRRAAADGLRLIALAERTLDAVPDDDRVYEDLTFLGLVGLLDPPRRTVRPALDACRAAGVRVVMATGDQGPTASAVARAVGLADDDVHVVRGAEIREDADEATAVRVRRAQVVARASPEQKLRLLRLHQRAGAVVAMLGDGVNDAPALHQADIGVAMGKRGTQVARQAADMVLEDDELGTVVVAVEQGRVIFGNLRKFVVYLLGCNLSEILTIGLASALGWGLPVLPLQILYLNLITDVFPAVALGVGEGDPSVMRRPPRDPTEAFLTPGHWGAIVLHSVLITGAVLGAYAAAGGPLGLSYAQSVTVAFLVLGFSQLWHVFDMADRDAPVLVNDVTRNRWVWGAIALCTVLLLGGVTLPGLHGVLGAVPLPAVAWGVALLVSLLPLVVLQLARAARRRG
ncbi:MAG TPA: cation-transporting P-type ATPase [Sandaracinaceae bacterium LLY-WYZ-13_1]|nr:cation-transporting P-type ATPase [Sandaracinaceae bacterium LLY-WYZ-13_1]